jgi:membrane associated rhomboid family serine protease
MLSRNNIRHGRVWTLLTHSITHIEFFHLLSNSIGLYFFGGQIERIFGPMTFLRLYLSGAVLGGLIQASTNFADSPMIGSSNAVSALLGFFVARYPK